MKISHLLSLLAIGASLPACATKTVEGPTVPIAYSNPAPTSTQGSHVPSTSKPKPAPTPDPLAPAPLPQKSIPPGVSPLSHGADQPIYQRQQ